MTAPVTVRAAIDAPAERVWDLVSDVTRMGEWSPETRSCRWLGEPAAPEVGARFAGRNQFRGPGNWNIDFSIFRGFPIGGAGKRVEFRTEVFNLTNTPMWGRPNNDVTSNNFGRTTTVGEDTPGGARSRDAGSGERQIRFGLRFQF